MLSKKSAMLFALSRVYLFKRSRSISSTQFNVCERWDLFRRSGALATAGDGRVLKLYSNNSGSLSVVFNFSGLAQPVSLSAVFKQSASSDVFYFQAQNSAGTWVNVGSTSGALEPTKA